MLVEAQCAGLPCFVSDTVDPDAAFTDRLHFLPRNDTAAWVAALGQESFARDADAPQKALAAGYDIRTTAEFLQNFYLRRYKEVTP